MALSEYMPYGAPELLDGARARMARSTLFASLTVAALVSVLGAILAHSVTIAIIEPGEDRRYVLEPPPLVPPANYDTPRSTKLAKPSVDLPAIPVPVPDPVAPIQDPTLPGTLDEINGAKGPGAAEPAGHVGSIGLTTPEPAIGEFVVVDTYPALVKSIEPIYPDLPREAGIEGVVRVLMLVGLDGHVARAVVAPGGSVPMLDEAALVAARGCVFTPALTNNHPVKVWVSRSYRFSLH